MNTYPNAIEKIKQISDETYYGGIYEFWTTQDRAELVRGITEIIGPPDGIDDLEAVWIVTPFSKLHIDRLYFSFEKDKTLVTIEVGVGVDDYDDDGYQEL